MVKDFLTVNKKSVLIFTIVFFAELLVILALTRINGIEIFFRGDGRDYQNLANNLIYHQTLAITSNPPYLPTSFRTPIYPFWLAFIYLISRSYNVAVFIGAFVFALSASTAYLIGREIFTEKIAMIAAFLFGLEPWALYQAGFLTAEQIFMPLFLLSTYLFIRYLKSGAILPLCLSSLILGISVLTRPVALFFIVIFMFFIFIFESKYSIRRSFKISMLVFLIFITVLTPWLIRNKVVLHSWQFSSASGIRIFGDYIMLKQYLGKTKPDEVVDLYEESRRLLGVKNNWDAMSVENSNKMSQIALREIKSNFGSFLKMYSKNIILFFFKNSYSNIFFDFSVPDSKIQSKIVSNLKQTKYFSAISLIRNASFGAKILLLLVFFWPAVTFLAIFGVLEIFREKWKNPLLWFLILWVLYFSILTASARDLSRYRLAIQMPLFTLAVYGFYKAKKFFFNDENV